MAHPLLKADPGAIADLFSGFVDGKVLICAHQLYHHASHWRALGAAYHVVVALPCSSQCVGEPSGVVTCRMRELNKIGECVDILFPGNLAAIGDIVGLTGAGFAIRRQDERIDEIAHVGEPRDMPAPVYDHHATPAQRLDGSDYQQLGARPVNCRRSDHTHGQTYSPIVVPDEGLALDFAVRVGEPARRGVLGLVNGSSGEAVDIARTKEDEFGNMRTCGCRQYVAHAMHVRLLKLLHDAPVAH